jgi:site-specific DNA-cytosine methylase
MKVAVICEYSGVVRDAFIAAGHDAISYDLLETEQPGPHIKGDVLRFKRDYWSQYDLLICHPPCTDLAVSGARWFVEKKHKQEKSLEFVRYLMNLPCDRIAIENPVSIISSKIRRPEQIIQPWMFGHPESKKTCLWLKNLPVLKPTNVLSIPDCGYWNNQSPEGQNRLLVNGKTVPWNNPKTGYLRAKTYEGIAKAMAEQWSEPGYIQLSIVG